MERVKPQYIVRYDCHDFVTGHRYYIDSQPYRWRWLARLVARWETDVLNDEIAVCPRVIEVKG